MAACGDLSPHPPTMFHDLCLSNAGWWRGPPENAVIATWECSVHGDTGCWQPVSFGDNRSDALGSSCSAQARRPLVLDSRSPVEGQYEALTYTGINLKYCLSDRWKQICHATRYMLHWMQLLQTSPSSFTLLLCLWLLQAALLLGISLSVYKISAKIWMASCICHRYFFPLYRKNSFIYGLFNVQTMGGY